MRYIVKQRIFSLTDAYQIMDEHKRPAYEARGKLLSLTGEVRLRDAAGREVARINKKLLAFRPAYKISGPEGWIATVRKRWTLFGEKMKIESLLGSMKIRGKAFSYEYDIIRDGALVARISKRYLSLRDSYGVEIADEANAPMLIACCLVIDQIYHEDRD